LRLVLSSWLGEGFLQKVTYEGHAEVKRPAHTAERIMALAGFLQSYISFFNYFEFKRVCILKMKQFFISVHSFSKYFLSFFEKHYSILACELYTRKIEGGGLRQIVELLLNIFT